MSLCRWSCLLLRTRQGTQMLSSDDSSRSPSLSESGAASMPMLMPGSGPRRKKDFGLFLRSAPPAGRSPLKSRGKKGIHIMAQNNRSEATSRPVRIIEVGPRDGLQNERDIVSTEDKESFVNALSRTSVAESEIGPFVSPHANRQLADCHDVEHN